MAFERGDGAGREEKLRGSDSFLVVTSGTIAQIEDQVLRALMIELDQLFAKVA